MPTGLEPDENLVVDRFTPDGRSLGPAVPAWVASRTAPGRVRVIEGGVEVAPDVVLLFVRIWRPPDSRFDIRWVTRFDPTTGLFGPLERTGGLRGPVLSPTAVRSGRSVVVGGTYNGRSMPPSPRLVRWDEGGRWSEGPDLSECLDSPSLIVRCVAALDDGRIALTEGAGLRVLLLDLASWS